MIDIHTVRIQFGNRLKQTRVNYDLSLRELAELAEIPHSLIADIEAGNRPAGPDVAIKLADAFDLCDPEREQFLLNCAQTTKKHHLLKGMNEFDAQTINYLPRVLLKAGIKPDMITESYISRWRSKGDETFTEDLKLELANGRNLTLRLALVND